MEDQSIERKAVAQLKQGQLSGLAPLVQRYQLSAVRAAFLITGDRAMAEDVVQSAFLRAVQTIHSFDDWRPFGPWFLRSVVNAALRAVQRGQRQVSFDVHQEQDEAGERFAELLASPDPGPEHLAEQAEFRRKVRLALEQLAPEQRAVVVLRYYLGLSEHEMADQFGVPPGTIKSRLHAARKSLRKLLSF